MVLRSAAAAFVDVVGGPRGFSNVIMPVDAARMVNRQYLIQHLNSLWVRYLFADDTHLVEDFKRAGYRLESRTTHRARYLKG
jgi:hypothetical protein